MPNDLPDFQTEVYSESVEATAFRTGLDADKPASPAKGNIWLATDTTILYVAYSAGSWTNLGALYLLLAGGTMSGNIAMGSNKVTGLAAPTADNDAARKVYIDDLLDDVSHSEPSRSLGTEYQNTSGKIRLVTITINTSNATTGYVRALVGSASPPTAVQAAFGTADTNTGVIVGSFSFMVPPNHYYKTATVGGGITLLDWHEWDLH